MRILPSLAFALLSLVLPTLAGGQTVHHVAPGQSIQDVINAAQPGDTVLLEAGDYYASRLTIRRPGITLAGAGRDLTRLMAPIATQEDAILEVILSSSLPSPVASIAIRDLTIDAEWGPRRGLTVEMYPPDAELVVSGVQVIRSGRHCIDLRRGKQVRIADSVIRGCLNAANGHTDAHGIVSYVDLVVEHTEISKFSGDAVQMANSRWRYLRMEDVHAWLEPLREDEERNGFAVGVVPGENALDTKTANPAAEKARVEIVNGDFHGYRPGSARILNNMAALNLKQAIVFDVRDTIIRNSEIAFRVRGAGSVSTPNLPQQAEGMVSNVIIDDVDVAFRSEDGLERFMVAHATIARAGTVHVIAPVSRPAKTMVLNSAFVGLDVPVEWADESNRRVDALGADFRPLDGSVLIGAADVSVATPTDYYGQPRDTDPDSGAVEATITPGPDPDPVVLDFAATIGATFRGAGQEQGIVLILPADQAAAIQAQLGKSVTVRLTVRP